MSPASKAQQKATAKYKKSNYDRVELLLPKGRKQAIQDAASAQGESLNGFVSTAIDERIERLGGPQDRATGTIDEWDGEAYGQYARSIDMIGEISPKAKEIILSGKSGVTRDYIRGICNMSATKVKKIAKQVESGTFAADK